MDQQDRRHFLMAVLGTVAARAATAGIRFASSGFIWQNNIEEGIQTTARFGFKGIEPFRQHVTKYLDRPRELKRLLDDAGIQMVSCSNGGNMMVDFLDPASRARTVEDHVRFAGDFIAVFGCRHCKINMGRRPEGGPTKDQLSSLADGLNELGRRTKALGLKLAPHPHIWSPLEREEEINFVLRKTDPSLVYLVTDTAHLTLGGMDPVALIREQYGRVAAVHFKDTEAKYRGYRGATPTQEEHRKVNLYKDLGTGGVDFFAVHALLSNQNYQGWITLDLDPPRPGDGSIDEMLRRNKDYLEKGLRVKL
ncbi:MAG: TIM barrel protein [Acidobacteriia bacterium]|nr:TIM barrel protein [Terriglobia bacterium]